MPFVLKSSLQEFGPKPKSKISSTKKDEATASKTSSTSQVLLQPKAGIQKLAAALKQLFRGKQRQSCSKDTVVAATSNGGSAQASANVSHAIPAQGTTLPSRAPQLAASRLIDLNDLMSGCLSTLERAQYIVSLTKDAVPPVQKKTEAIPVLRVVYDLDEPSEDCVKEAHRSEPMLKDDDLAPAQILPSDVRTVATDALQSTPVEKVTVTRGIVADRVRMLSAVPRGVHADLSVLKVFASSVKDHFEGDVDSSQNDLRSSTKEAAISTKVLDEDLEPRYFSSNCDGGHHQGGIVRESLTRAPYTSQGGTAAHNQINHMSGRKVAIAPNPFVSLHKEWRQMVSGICPLILIATKRRLRHVRRCNGRYECNGH